MLSPNQARTSAHDPGHPPQVTPDSPRIQQPAADLSSLRQAVPPSAERTSSLLGLFEKALDVVPAGPLYSSMREQYQRIKNSHESAQFPVDFERAISRIDEIDRRTLVQCIQTAFADGKYYRVPVSKRAGSEDLETDLAINGQSDRQVRAFTRALLEPRDTTQIGGEASAYATYLSRASRVGDLLARMNGVGAFVTAFMIPTITPLHAVVFGVGAYGITTLLQAGFFARSSSRAGLVLENLDAVETLQSGRFRSLHERMQDLFLGQTDCRSSEAILRADSFLIARTLRILGTPGPAIQNAFQKTTSVELPGNPLISLLEEKMATAGLTLTEDALIRMYLDNPSKDQLSNRETLDLLHRVYFAGEAWEGLRSRSELARQILAADNHAK